MIRISTMIWVLAGTFVGAWLGIVTGQPFIGALCGGVMAWPIGHAITTRKRRWWAVAFLFANYILAWELAGIYGLLILLSCTGIVLFMSSAILRDLYEGNVWQAFIHHLKVLTGLFIGFHIVSEGQNVVPLGREVVLGPRLLIVKPDTSVVLERGTRRTRVLGPGVYSTAPFEYVKEILNLKPHAYVLTLSQLQTKEHLQTNLIISLIVGIKVRASVRAGNEPISDTEKSLLEDLLNYPDWRETAKNEVESQIRKNVAMHSLQDLISDYPEIVEHILTATNQKLVRQGIWISRIIIERIEPIESIELVEKSVTPSQTTCVLFLAANPSDTTRLHLDKEYRGIRESLQKAGKREEFLLHNESAVRVSELIYLFLLHRPTIVHFSGHGTQEGEIILEDESGNHISIPHTTIQNICSILNRDSNQIRCVILNACFSELQAQSIAENVDIVIGIESVIDDSSAIRFTSAFYTALGENVDMLTAFDLARENILLNGSEGNDNFRLFHRPEIDPRIYHLF